jgi:hypothetical protein
MSSLCAAAEPARFADLKKLVGNWEAKTGKGGIVRVGYRLISNDSALVQSFVTPSGRETLTIFNADGARILATHYCAQGNQPRLALDGAASNDRAFVFRFLDATNLPSPSDEHLVRLEMRVEGSDAYTELETYEGQGKPDVTTLRFKRVP